MSYLENVIKAAGGYAAPEEPLVEDVKEAPEGYHYMPDGELMRDDEHAIRSSLDEAGYLVPEEQELADALLDIVEKHGKFDADNTGVWAGYTSAKENAENAEIGVKCGNCVFWEAPNGCKIIVAETEEAGLCRFAVLPDGSVTAALEKDADDPCWEGYVQLGTKMLRGKVVPNCVPLKAAQSLEEIQEVLSSDDLEEVLAMYNSNVGGVRQVGLSAAAEVAARSYVSYKDAYQGEELTEAVLWELHSYLEYATLGVDDEAEILSAHNDLLNEGHPAQAVVASLEARIRWAADAPELEESSREAIKTALSPDADSIEVLHATSRVKALVSSGKLSAHTTDLVNSLMSN